MKANIKIQKTGANHALPSPFILPASDLGVGRMETAGSHWSEIVRVPSPLLGVTESPA